MKKKKKRIRGTRDLYFGRTGRKRGVKPLAPVCKTRGNKGAGQPGSISRRLLAAAARLPATCAGAAAAAAAGAAATTAAAAVAAPCPTAPPPHPTPVTAFAAAAPARRFACLGTLPFAAPSRRAIRCGIILPAPSAPVIAALHELTSYRIDELYRPPVCQQQKTFV